MTPEEFKKRTKGFAVRAIRLTEALPRSTTGRIIARQLLRSATSVEANYRSACRARRRADFIAKMGIVEEECDESRYWMELLVESGQVEAALLEDLMNEVDQLLALAVASIRTARVHKESANRNPQSTIENGACNVA